MCGIIGVVTKKLAITDIVEGLKRLEYRGYDSSGVAILEGDKITRFREVGKLRQLQSVLDKQMLYGGCGIGHTRWATHGKPDKENAHPHCDNEQSIAVVHNGIIENYMELTKELKGRNIILKSQTDTEVIPHLLYLELKDKKKTKMNIIRAIRSVVRKLKGSYALCIVVRGIDCVFCVKLGSPLVIGVGKQGKYVASDSVALKNVDSIAYLCDDDICVLESERIVVYDKNLLKKDIDYIKVDVAQVDVVKGEYDHFMQKEIDECNNSVVSTMQNLVKQDNQKLNQILSSGEIHITACGTALNAGKVLAHIMKVKLGINACIECASEYRYNMLNLSKSDVGIVISQSGETADSIGCVESMQSSGMSVIGVTNVVTSQIARMVDVNLSTIAGKELAVASTKAYVAQVGVMYYLVNEIAKSRGINYRLDLQKIEYIALNNNVDYYKIWNSVIDELVDCNDLYILGRGLDYIVAEEVALKIKEISYIHCEAMPMGELKHGSLALITQKTKVIVLLTQQNLVDKVVSNIREIMARGGQVVLVTNKQMDIEVWRRVEIMDVDDVYSVLVSVRPMQQLAYLLAIKRGNDPDKPRNLAKSVTVE